MQAGQGQLGSPTGHSYRVAPPHRRIVCALALCLISCFAACSRLQLPAIDPNGNSIFLPFPNTTQLDLPPLRTQNGVPGIIPSPAFTEPVAPPACLDAGGVCNMMDGRNRFINSFKRHFDGPGKLGAIQMTPMRVVAPVGGEVVLLAGICGADGYLVKKQPLEWMLSPDSVGNFIAVGDDRPEGLGRIFYTGAPKVEKLDVDFARGRTSSKETLITRGTPQCADDIQLLEGQTWLSISSPSEGISRVTVLAPDSEIWDQRRLTATIYWVDAQWEFPTPQIRRSEEVIQLVTRVTMAENLVPAEGWIVEYTIADPGVARFEPATGSNKAVVRVNADGQAIVNIVAGEIGRGTTPVLVDVIRPASPEDNLPRLSLGRGQTTVTFSAPALALEAFGPATGAPGEQLTYAASIGNPGDVDAENVELRFIAPADTRIVSTTPEASSASNGGRIWEQGVLAAGRQLDVSVVLEALRPNTFDVVFEARGSGLPPQQRTVRTEVLQASVEANFAPTDGIAQAEIGETVAYDIDVTNNGRQTLTNLRLLVESDPGLPESINGENRVEQIIPRLQPGETRSIGVVFRVQQQGQLNARLQVLNGENLLAEKNSTIQGLPPRERVPEIDVSIDFPESLPVGARQREARIRVLNPGEVRLTDIEVRLAIDPALSATMVDSQNRSNIRLEDGGRTLVWSVRDLLANPNDPRDNYFRELVVGFDVGSATNTGALTATATSAENVSAQAQAQFQAVAGETAPVTPPNPTPQTRTGTLGLEWFDWGDPSTVGAEMRFDLIVTNNQNLPDRNVRVLVRIPQGIRLQRVSRDGISEQIQFGENNTIIIPSIQFLRPGAQDSVKYTLVFIPQVPQPFELRAQIYSDEQPDPVEAVEPHTVNPR